MPPEDHPYGQPDPVDRSQRPPELFDGRSEQYAPYDPRYDYDGEQPGRSRGTVVAIFIGLGVLGLVVGVGAAKLFGGGGASNSSALRPVVAATTVSPSQQPVSTSADTSAATATPVATPGETRTTARASAQRADYSPIGLNASARKGLDFGFLTKVSEQNGTVSVRFDRATFYTGAAAIKHNGGVPPDDDYVIENTNPELRTFVVDPKASIVATNRLTDHTNTAGQEEALTLDQFVINSQTAVRSGGVPVWLRHLNGLTGPVTALSEQFVP